MLVFATVGELSFLGSLFCCTGLKYSPSESSWCAIHTGGRKCSDHFALGLLILNCTVKNTKFSEGTQ